MFTVGYVYFRLFSRLLESPPIVGYFYSFGINFLIMDDFEDFDNFYLNFVNALKVSSGNKLTKIKGSFTHKTNRCDNDQCNKY